jgi:vacuolar-type H+-ATPase subunit H
VGCIDSGKHSYCKTADRKEVQGCREIEQEVREKEDGVIDRQRKEIYKERSLIIQLIIGQRIDRYGHTGRQ